MPLGILGCGTVWGSERSLWAVFRRILPLFSTFGELHAGEEGICQLGTANTGREATVLRWQGVGPWGKGGVMPMLNSTTMLNPSCAGCILDLSCFPHEAAVIYCVPSVQPPALPSPAPGAEGQAACPAGSPG